MFFVCVFFPLSLFFACNLASQARPTTTPKRETEDHHIYPSPLYLKRNKYLKPNMHTGPCHCVFFLFVPVFEAVSIVILER